MTAFPHPSRARSVAATAALAAALLGLAGCGQDEPTSADDTAGETPAESDSTSAGTTTPATESPSGTAGTTETSSGTGTQAPVFFVGDTPQGPRLFRELREVQADNPLEEAAALLTAGDTADPDYRSLFPEGAFESVAFADGAFVVTVPDDGWRTPVGQSRREARLAVQQLVYTLQAVQQQDAPVRVELDGEPEETLFGVPVGEGLTAAPEVEVLALVNVTTPGEGATVTDTFTAEGLANSFEATVPWQVRDPGGEVVLDGFTTAGGWGDRLYPWVAEVDVSTLPPGEYTFVAMTDDPSGGEGGGPQEDSKTIVVE